MTQYLVCINQNGKPTPQVWRDTETAQQHYAPSAPRGYLHDQFISKCTIAPEDEGLSVDELVKKYQGVINRG
jgi:hypothetical protein